MMSSPISNKHTSKTTTKRGFLTTLQISECLFVSEDGNVLTWGWNEHGICGTGDEVNVHQPRIVSLPEGYCAVLVGCGGGHIFISLRFKQ